MYKDTEKVSLTNENTRLPQQIWLKVISLIDDLNYKISIFSYYIIQLLEPRDELTFIDFENHNNIMDDSNQMNMSNRNTLPVPLKISKEMKEISQLKNNNIVNVNIKANVKENANSNSHANVKVNRLVKMKINKAVIKERVSVVNAKNSSDNIHNIIEDNNELDNEYNINNSFENNKFSKNTTNNYNSNSNHIKNSQNNIQNITKKTKLQLLNENELESLHILIRDKIILETKNKTIENNNADNNVDNYNNTQHSVNEMRIKSPKSPKNHNIDELNEYMDMVKIPELTGFYEEIDESKET